ncbi:cytochrome P450 CYP94D108-like [Typha angustifolia]|uniref:cytochrome P450 CYP94D108-like n=1 Tax=Typha angustifolia TaxID=59011 RepID=UPI003C2DF4A2
MELSSLHLAFFLFFLPLFIYLFFFFRHGPSKKKPSVHGLKPYPIIGYLPYFVKNRHRFLDWTTEVILQSSTQTMVFRSLGQVSGIVTANPSNVEHILKSNFDNYPKGERTFTMLKDFLGHGIFNSDGEEWRSQRKAASFEFNKRSLRNFIVNAVKFETVNRLLPLLTKAQEENNVVDIQDVLERFAFDNICKVAFDVDPACLSDDYPSNKNSNFMEDFGRAQFLVGARFFDILDVAWRVKKFLNIGSERQIKESILAVHNFAVDIIRSRKARSLDDKDHDLLSRFAANEGYSEEFLRDMVINFLIAGRETTSSALTWFFWILSTRPDVEQRIVQEIQSVRCHSEGETFSYDELHEMNYLHAAITESMRIYPPVPIDTQSCMRDDVMPDGTFVTSGSFVTYSAYAMGRSEKIWGEDSNEYKPERWLDKDGHFKPESPFRFPVFHAGPRMCLGKEMAYIQMKSIVASIVERFKLRAVRTEEKGGNPPEHVLSFTLRMRGGLPVLVRKREE